MSKKRQFTLLGLFLVFSVGVFHFSIDAIKTFDLIPTAQGFGLKNLLNIDWDHAINSILSIFATINGFFISIGIGVLHMATDAGNYELLHNNQAIVNSWTIIRDFLNLLFVALLLYSAFATVFNIQAFHIKKVLFMVLLMALLVNFSYPISRFIIDAFNVPMYYIMEQTFQGVSTGITLIDGTRFKELFVPDTDSLQPEMYFATVLFGFMFMITIATLAILFMIRFIVLVILVILSPVGFTCAMFPSTARYASQYWDTFIKYAIFGPVMMLFLALALNIMNEFQQANLLGATDFAISNAGAGANAVKPNFFANAMFSMVPVIILWAGILNVNKFGIAFSDVVVNRAKKVGNWMGRKYTAPVRIPAMMAGKAVGDRYKKTTQEIARSGKLFGKKIPLVTGTEARQEKIDRFAARVTGGKEELRKHDVRREIKEAREMEEVVPLSEAYLKMRDNSQSAEKRAQYARYVANKGGHLLDSPEKLQAALKAAQGSKDAQGLQNSLLQSADKGAFKGLKTGNQYAEMLGAVGFAQGSDGKPLQFQFNEELEEQHARYSKLSNSEKQDMRNQNDPEFAAYEREYQTYSAKKEQEYYQPIRAAFAQLQKEKEKAGPTGVLPQEWQNLEEFRKSVEKRTSNDGDVTSAFEFHLTDINGSRKTGEAKENVFKDFIPTAPVDAGKVTKKMLDLDNDAASWIQTQVTQGARNESERVILEQEYIKRMRGDARKEYKNRTTPIPAGVDYDFLSGSHDDVQQPEVKQKLQEKQLDTLRTMAGNNRFDASTNQAINSLPSNTRINDQGLIVDNNNQTVITQTVSELYNQYADDNTKNETLRKTLNELSDAVRQGVIEGAKEQEAMRQSGFNESAYFQHRINELLNNPQTQSKVREEQTKIIQKHPQYSHYTVNATDSSLLNDPNTGNQHPIEDLYNHIANNDTNKEVVRALRGTPSSTTQNPQNP